MRILARLSDRDESTPIVASEDGAIICETAVDVMQHMGWALKLTHQQDVGSGNAVNITWTVPTSNIAPDGHVHMTYTVICEGEAEIALYENAVMTANTGNAMVPVCVNRQFPQVSALAAGYSNATINTTNSVLLDIEVIGNAKQVGGRADTMFHWTLCRGKTYASVVTNQSGAANETTIKLMWGRHVGIA